MAAMMLATLMLLRSTTTFSSLLISAMRLLLNISTRSMQRADGSPRSSGDRRGADPYRRHQSMIRALRAVERTRFPLRITRQLLFRQAALLR
jgi:hypothetical protein